MSSDLNQLAIEEVIAYQWYLIWSVGTIGSIGISTEGVGSIGVLGFSLVVLVVLDFPW